MINEGLTSSDKKTQVKSEMVRQLRKLGATSPDAWERATFQALTGGTREEVDWDVQDNQAGYYLWIKAFDELVQELIDDGFAVVEPREGSDEKRIVPTGDEELNGSWS